MKVDERGVSSSIQQGTEGLVPSAVNRTVQCSVSILVLCIQQGLETRHLTACNTTKDLQELSASLYMYTHALTCDTCTIVLLMYGIARVLINVLLRAEPEEVYTYMRAGQPHTLATSWYRCLVANMLLHCALKRDFQCRYRPRHGYCVYKTRILQLFTTLCIKEEVPVLANLKIDLQTSNLTLIQKPSFIYIDMYVRAGMPCAVAYEEQYASGYDDI